MSISIPSALWGVVWTIFGTVFGAVWDLNLKQKRIKKIEILEKQLSEFYWPLYAKMEQQEMIYQKLELKLAQDSEQETLHKLEKEVILPMCDEILKIIENKIYLARANEEFTQKMLDYIKHLTI